MSASSTALLDPLTQFILDSRSSPPLPQHPHPLPFQNAPTAHASCTSKRLSAAKFATVKSLAPTSPATASPAPNPVRALVKANTTFKMLNLMSQQHTQLAQIAKPEAGIRSMRLSLCIAAQPHHPTTTCTTCKHLKLQVLFYSRASPSRYIPFSRDSTNRKPPLQYADGPSDLTQTPMGFECDTCLLVVRVPSPSPSIPGLSEAEHSPADQIF